MSRHVFIFTFGFLFCFAGLVSAQPDWGSIVRVTDGNAVGTGFVVAVNDLGTAEVWTNAHVTRANSTPTIRFGNSRSEATGKVVEWKLDRTKGVDVAKLIVTVPDGVVVTPLAIGRDRRNLDSCSSCGWKLGSQLSIDLLRSSPETTTVGASFLPSPMGGQSGGPVTDQNNEVVGVVTWEFGRFNKFGVAQPISNFTGERNFVQKAQPDPTAKIPREIGAYRHADQKKP